MKLCISRKIVSTCMAAIFLVTATAANLSAQERSSDPTAIKTPEEKMQVSVVPEQKRFQDSSWIKIGSGLLCTAGGTVLCLFAANLKGDYNVAIDAYNANQTDATTNTKNVAAGEFFVPLFSGIGLAVTGMFLVISGFSDGLGVYGYQQISPATPATETVPSGPAVYAYMTPARIGILIK